MFRRGHNPAPSTTHRAFVCVLCCAAGLSSLRTIAQTSNPEGPADSDDQPQEISRDESLAHYLETLDLSDVLAAHLRGRIDSAQGKDRVRAAEQLAKLYVRLLSAPGDTTDRRALERESRQLLDRVPEADSFELRIDLARATYRRAELSAERERLRSATPEEIAEAKRVLQDVLPVFAGLGSRLQERVVDLERQADASTEENESLRTLLADARRLRSLARYYEGWTRLYLATLENKPADAEDAMRAFGWILNAVPGKLPSLERAPKSTMRFEHVARAAIGVAICQGFRRNETEALRWIEELELAEGLPKGVEDQLWGRKVAILARAQRWADAIAITQARRKATGSRTPEPLSPTDARLLVVLALDAVRDGNLRDGLKQAASEAAQIGLADLIAQGQINQLVELVHSYGTLPIGQDGFLVAYVRGIQSFEDVREQHKVLEPPGEAPAKSAALINDYRKAAGLLASALKDEHEPAFRTERAPAYLRMGLARYFAGDMQDAVDALENAYTRGEPGEKHEKLRHDALWFAVVAADAWTQGNTSTKAADAAAALAKRDALVAMFMKAFPASDNATKLLVRQTSAGGLSDREAVDILLRVPAQSAMYIPARRQAARLLYSLYRASSGQERDVFATRTVGIADEVMRAELAAASGSGEQAKDAAQSCITRARQLLDVALAMPVPDLARAESALATIAQASARHQLHIADIEPELLFRTLQIALAKSDTAGARLALDRLHAAGGLFSGAADRVVFQRAWEAFKQNPQDMAAATDVAMLAVRLAEVLPKADPSLATIRDAGARAAASLWESTQDTAMRDRALALDTAQLDAGVRTVESLRRIAALRESNQETQAALDAWNEIFAGTLEGSTDWLEARFHTLRLLARTDPAQASRAYAQFRTLYPEPPAEPWGSKFLELDIPARAASPVPIPRPLPAGSPDTKGAPGGG